MRLLNLYLAPMRWCWTTDSWVNAKFALMVTFITIAFPFGVALSIAQALGLVK